MLSVAAHVLGEINMVATSDGPMHGEFFITIFTFRGEPELLLPMKLLSNCSPARHLVTVSKATYLATKHLDVALP